MPVDRELVGVLELEPVVHEDRRPAEAVRDHRLAEPLGRDVDGALDERAGVVPDGHGGTSIRAEAAICNRYAVPASTTITTTATIASATAATAASAGRRRRKVGLRKSDERRVGCQQLAGRARQAKQAPRTAGRSCQSGRPDEWARRTLGDVSPAARRQDAQPSRDRDHLRERAPDEREHGGRREEDRREHDDATTAARRRADRRGTARTRSTAAGDERGDREPARSRPASSRAGGRMRSSASATGSADCHEHLALEEGDGLRVRVEPVLQLVQAVPLVVVDEQLGADAALAQRPVDLLAPRRAGRAGRSRRG